MRWIKQQVNLYYEDEWMQKLLKKVLRSIQSQYK